MPTDIDKLQIEIIANVNKADNAIDNFIGRLDKLTVSLGKVGNTNITGFSNSIKTMSDGMKNFSSVKMPDFNRTAKGIEKFGEINSSNISKVGSSLKPLAEGVNLLSSTSFDNKNLQNLINSITRLSNANVGSLNSVNFSGIGNSINTLANSLANAPKIQQSVISMTNAVAYLSKSGQNIPIVTSSLGQLGTSLRAFMKNMSNAPTISADTIMFSQAIATLANAGVKTGTTASSLDALAISLKNFMKTMSTAPTVNNNIIQMTNALANLASQGGKVGRASNSIVRGLNSASASANKAKKSFSGLAGVIGKFYATYWLLFRSISKLGEAINVSSALTEVQNVVDVTFGEYASLVEKMSETSITDFGMSELTVKQVSSRFQAMGSAMGFAQGKMADMSIELTKLTADMASFYNVEQKDVAEDLESIFTGQTRPLRTYGLDLTEATLKEWAMKQGMDANIDSMSQMEKTMLRYNYVMANTGAAQGDFLRTQDTWANQVRILKQNLEQLAIIIGGNLINALKPLVKALNAAMEKVIAFAKVVSDSLGKIFGWKYEEGSGGFASEFEDAADATDDLASGTGKVAKNVEKINKGIRAFDELKVINLPEPTTPSKGGSGGGGGLGGGDAAGAAGQWVKDTEEAFYESDLDTLYKLGDYISQSLSRAMESVDWDAVYKKARNFGSGLASFLNGLISPRLFGNVGRTIASSLNTAIYATLSFGETFDWQDFGDSIAEGINDFFKTFDFGALAQTLNVWVDGIIELVGTTIKETDKGAILDGFKEFFDEIELDTVAVIVGAILIKKIGVVKLSELALSGISNGIVMSLSKKLGTEATWSGVAGGIGAGISGAIVSMGGIGGMLTMDLATIFGAGTFAEIGVTIGVAIIGGIIAAIGGWNFGQWLNEKITGEEIELSFTEQMETIKSSFTDGSWSEALTLWRDDIAMNLAQMTVDAELLWDDIKAGASESLEETRQNFKQFADDWKKIFSDIASSISSWWTNDVKPWFTKEKWAELASGIKQGVSEKWNEFIEWWKTTGIYQWYEQHIKPWFSKEKWSFDGIRQGLTEGFNNAIAGAKQIWNSFANWLNQYLVWDIPDFKLGNMTFEGGRIVLGQLPTFETGGFPEDGLFMANHGELVGQFSNGKTAVANNAQIVEGIKAGVYDAVVSAMRDTRGNGGTVRVVGDSQGIFNLVREAADEYFETTGEPAFTF